MAFFVIGNSQNVLYNDLPLIKWMCCVIKGLAVPLFMIRISSGGMKAADFGKNRKKWTKAAAFGQKLDEICIFCQASLNAAI